MPLREIRRRFTKSDLVILAWRSQEQAYQLKAKYGSDKEVRRRPRYVDESVTDEESEAQPLPSKKRKSSGKKMKVRREDIDAQVPAGLPDRFFDEEGGVDLRRVTGEEAYKFLAAQGIKLPRYPGRAR